uniref:LOW QUALITY PROTEIN: apolipoprotein L5-like n=2 Tax=Callorhinus ursinus TaxID=34884 RepID=A0A3Q7Q5D3_CALUR|nr:LOW QUALITY PROTEIN: apolipoprotein L5-like [Callorhinus ursinus]
MLPYCTFMPRALLGSPSQSWKNNHVTWAVHSNESNTLYHILMEELIRQKEATMPGNLSEEEKMFLLCFPLQKYKLEKSIRELHAIAHQVDATHKMLTKTSLVASSSGNISGLMSLLGLALAPVTVGGSLMLSAAGLGLGLRGCHQHVDEYLLESRSNSAARDRASRLVPMETTVVYEAFEEIRLPAISAALSCVDRGVRVIKNVKDFQACQMATANSGFMAKVNNFMATNHVPFWRGEQLQTAVEGSALSMTKGVRLLGAAGAGFLLVQDVKSLLQSWKHLEEGARAETTEELRTVALQLEQELSQLTQRYKLTLRGRAGRRARPRIRRYPPSVFLHVVPPGRAGVCPQHPAVPGSPQLLVPMLDCKLDWNPISRLFILAWTSGSTPSCFPHTSCNMVVRNTGQLSNTTGYMTFYSRLQVRGPAWRVALLLAYREAWGQLGLELGSLPSCLPQLTTLCVRRPPSPVDPTQPRAKDGGGKGHARGPKARGRAGQEQSSEQSAWCRGNRQGVFPPPFLRGQGGCAWRKRQG